MNLNRQYGWTTVSIPRMLVAMTGAVAVLLLALASLWPGRESIAATNAGHPDAAPAPITFNRQIRPILADRCFTCHGPDSNKRISGLRLDKQDQAFGPLPKHPTQRAFVPGHPEQSLAYVRIISDDPTQIMPPPASHLKLTAMEKDLIQQWIAQGAKWEEHWAFVTPQRPEPPEVANKSWPRNDIDRFILARLDQEHLQPSPEADKATLIRRVSLDLTGIPPTLAQIDAFLADKSSDAYDKVVDRLLASPHYGEQMATQWMDYARYADSHGYEGDAERFMWHWRDWVINAYNSNMPFDQFTIEQLAGDLLPNATLDQKIATGFNRNSRINEEGGVNAEEWRIEGVIDRVEATSETWLGLTMGCCRCHDHKYDPITQKEFYQFSAYFNSVNEVGIGHNTPGNLAPLIKIPTTQQAARLAELNAKLTANKIETETRGLREEIKSINKSIDDTMVMEDLSTPRDTFVLIRGQYDKHGDQVNPGTPAILSPPPAGAPANRLGLAQWIVDPHNPLTSRVQANRLWAKFFGTGLVKTNENFGTQGEWPSHPELLDWLATEMIREKWDLKAFQRLIVTSATYRQSSSITPELLERDPENRLLARGSRVRLTAEVIRDQALAACGLLAETIGGPSVRPYEPADLWAGNAWGNLANYVPDTGDGLYRRSLYTFVKRTAPPANLSVFDMPNRETCVISRSRTNTPLQALDLLNDPTYVEAARVLAEHMLTEGGATPAERIAYGFRRITCRPPTASETAILANSFNEQLTSFHADRDAALKFVNVGAGKRNEKLDVPELAAYAMVASEIFNLDEMVTKK